MPPTDQPDFKSLFESAPGLYLILLPDLTIVAVSDAYLNATMTRRNEILGKSLFEVFPDNPDDPSATGVSNLRSSLNYVLQNKTAHTMAVQKYDIRRPDGKFEERFWSPLNKPVLNEKNEISCIIHRVEDVTEFIRLKKEELKQIEHAKEANKKLLDEIKEKQKAEEKFRNLLESAPDAMIIVNKNGEIVLLNHQVENLFGYSREDLMGQTIEMLIPDEFRKKHIGHRMNYHADPKIRTMGSGLKLFAQRKDGTRFPVEISLSPLETETGMLALASIRDVTIQKNLEGQLKKFNLELAEMVKMKTAELTTTVEQLKISEEKYKTIFYKSPLPKWIYDIETLQFLEVNETAIQHYGYSEEEFRNMTIKDIRPKEDLPLLMDDIEKVRPSAVTRHGIWRHLKKNGDTIFVETTAHSLDYNGKRVRMVVINDITEKIKAEKQLAAERNLLRSLIDNLPVFIYVKDIASRYIIGNKALVDLVGAESEKEILGKTVLDLFGPEIAPINFEEDKRVFELGESALNREESITTKPGQKLWLLTSKVALKDENNKIIGLIGISRDITERKNAELKIQQLNEELEQKVIDRTAELQSANKDLEAFSYSVSHDLRAPLRIIDGYAEILISDYKNKLDEEGNRVLGIITENARKMGKLIDDLLNLSHQGRKELIVQYVDMTRLVESVIAENEISRSKKEIFRISKLEPAYCDSSLIRQVWINLISNAVKYSAGRKESIIEINSSKAGKEIIYRVKDNGVGFDIKYSDKLFGVFQRLHKATDYEGTGVGLALVHRIITKHGGRVWAEAEKDKGATFYFSLPK